MCIIFVLYIDTKVLSADGQQNVGRISKQWSGLAQEYFTNADNFGIQCKLTYILQLYVVRIRMYLVSLTRQ